ncbi:MAG: DUF423 domain-containing protein [Methylacidiphilales bacterium]|nr:DUF423 domain-containing protein [Candidatus Methylacidiphilales bacterium]
MAPTSDRLALRLGAVLGLFGVILGALAAHGSVHDFLDKRHHLDLWHTALFYQWVHALALLAVGQGRSARRGTVICWLIGVVLFSGSLYLLALDSIPKWAGPLTPLGGLFLIAGWAWLWLNLIKKQSS